jgi:hypothetical protein
MLGTFPFSSTPYSTTEIETFVLSREDFMGEVVSLTVSLRQQDVIALNIEPRQGLTLDLKS